VSESSVRKSSSRPDANILHSAFLVIFSQKCRIVSTEFIVLRPLLPANFLQNGDEVEVEDPVENDPKLDVLFVDTTLLV
jgi:hypothetical protein